MKEDGIYADLAELLRESGEYVTTGSGVSMYPMLRFKKDPVLIRPLVGELGRYDVAVYSRGKSYVVHRVLKVLPEHYVIRGDNCIALEYVPKGDVVGVVAGFWRFGRFIDVSNCVYKLYSRVWVAANPLVRLNRILKSKSASAVNRLKVIWRKASARRP